jgi:DNA-binding LacI/PurR family transcriptional regulator
LKRSIVSQCVDGPAYWLYSQSLTKAPRKAGDVGYLATKSILKSGEAMTALFAGDDAAAVGAYKAIHENGPANPGRYQRPGFQ